jgi:hypothetical protein
MKIDQEYLKELLNTFIESPRSFIWVEDIVKKGIELDDKFLFHIQILEDQHFIECLDKKARQVTRLHWEATSSGKAGR